MRFILGFQDVMSGLLEAQLKRNVMFRHPYTIILYFLAGLIFGYFVPQLSWKGGVWLTIPWIARIFLVIASTGFKDGIAGSLGWLLLYSFPFVPAIAGAYAGTVMVKLISVNRKC